VVEYTPTGLTVSRGVASSPQEIYFEILFPQNKFISETYFLSMKRFRKAANKLEALKTIY
jgi:hypothetical protein